MADLLRTRRVTARRCFAAIAAVAGGVLFASLRAFAAASSLAPGVCMDAANTRVIVPAVGGGLVETRRVDADTFAVLLTGPVAFICAGAASGEEGDASAFHVTGRLSVSYFGNGRKTEFGGAVIGLYSELPHELDLRAVTRLMRGNPLGTGLSFTAVHVADAFVGRRRNRGARLGDACDGCTAYVTTLPLERNRRPTLIALCPWPGETIEVRVTGFVYLGSDEP